jgi:plasmid replication initiation protein
MAMQQLTLPGELVKKHNKLVRSKINIASKTASRICAALIACIRTDDKQFKEVYTVPIKDYLPEEDGRTYQRVKAACRELVGATVEKEWPDPDDPEGDPIFHTMPFFMSVKYRKGKVEAEFNPKMSGVLLQLQGVFTKYNLIEYISLPSLYSQRLFEILKSWENVESGEITLSVAELHHLLDTPSSFRADFAAFRRFVLEKAHKDIQEKTSLRFEWEPVKAGRSVEAIRFSFGPGRRTIAEAEAKKAKETKQKRLQLQRIRRATECAIARKGACITRDNTPIICKACQEWNICNDILRRGGKLFDPYMGM